MNKKGRTIFIGDIHGCYDELKLLIEKIKIQKEDTIYLVGDMIDKGPNSYEVLKFLYENRKQYNCVLGGQEVHFLNWLEGEKNGTYKKSFKILKKQVGKHYEKLTSFLKEWSNYYALGKKETQFLNRLEGEKNPRQHEFFTSLRKQIKKNTPEIIDFLKEMPKYIEKESFIALHGGLIPNKDITSETIQEIVTIKQYDGKPWYEYYKGNKTIIYGHWAVQGLEIREKTIGIDSACVYGGFLSAYILETKEVISQKALKQYYTTKNLHKKKLIDKILEKSHKHK